MLHFSLRCLYEQFFHHRCGPLARYQTWLEIKLKINLERFTIVSIMYLLRRDLSQLQNHNHLALDVEHPGLHTLLFAVAMLLCISLNLCLISNLDELPFAASHYGGSQHSWVHSCGNCHTRNKYENDCSINSIACWIILEGFCIYSHNNFCFKKYYTQPCKQLLSHCYQPKTENPRDKSTTPDCTAVYI